MRLASLLSLLLAFVPATAVAAEPIAFDTVDAVQVYDNGLMIVTGIRTGQSAPTTRDLYINGAKLLEKCEKLALMSLAKPGVYRFEVVDSGNNCRLARRTP